MTTTHKSDVPHWAPIITTNSAGCPPLGKPTRFVNKRTGSTLITRTVTVYRAHPEWEERPLGVHHA